MVEAALFASFLTDSRVFDACSTHWLATWNSVVREVSAYALWKVIPVDEKDGNPIFAAESGELDLALRIIQHEIVDESGSIYAWENVRQDETWDVRGRELVLNVGLTEISDRNCRTILSIWASPAIDGVDKWRQVQRLLIP